MLILAKSILGLMLGFVLALISGFILIPIKEITYWSKC